MMSKPTVTGLFCTFMLLAGAVALGGQPKSAVETLEVGQPLARFSLLKPASRIYVRYKIVGDARETLDMWRREVSFEKRDGRQEMHIFWRWDSVGERKFSRSEDFWFELNTFRPLTVTRRLAKDGKVTVRGFRYLPDRIEGMAGLPDNDQKDFLQLAKMPAYNWETDMELLQTLPLAIGYDAKIPFYEAGPGQDAPDYYEYKVIGEDKIKSADGNAVDCWVVGKDSADPQWGPTKLWFTKADQIMIREQTQLKDGTIFVKMLLPYDVGNDARRNLS
jgi:hypothetical protein